MIKEGYMADNKKFKEIIDFAIEREKEAVEFYHDLQKLVKFAERKKLLKDLEKTEKGHIKILENIRTGDVSRENVPDVQNLHISEYLVEAPFSEDMSYQDILITAMKREEASTKLYNDLASGSSNADAKQLFLKLASEEAKHKLKFEQIYDQDILTED
jgi:rubrerythrin